MQVYKVKIKKFFDEKAFLFSVFLLMSMYTFSFSNISDIGISKPFYLVMRLLSYGLVMIKFILDFFDKKYSLKELVIIICIGIYFLVISYNSRTINYLIYFIYVVVGKNVKYTKIIKTAFFAIFISSLIIFLSFALGVINETITIQPARRERHSIGFVYASYVATYSFYAILYYIYFRNKKIKNFELLILLVISSVIYYLSDTRSAFAFSLLAIFITFIVNHINYFKEYKNIYKYILYFCSCFFPLSILFLSLNFDSNNSILVLINKILSGRLSLTQYALKEYHVKLFGQFIKFNAAPLPGERYDVVDSAYMLYLLILGSVFFVLMIAFFIYMGHLISKKKDIYLYYIFIIVLAHSAFDPQLLQMSHSAFMYVLSYKNELISYER